MGVVSVRRTVLRTRTLLIAALVPLAAACGSSGPKPPTHAAFVAQADAICKTADATIAALPAPTAVDSIAAYAAPAATAVRAEYDGLRALRAPKGEQAQVDALMAEIARVVKVADGLVVVARTNDGARITAFINANSAVDAHANALAQAFGLKVCGAPPAASG